MASIFKIILTALLITSCGPFKKDNEPKDPIVPNRAELEEKYKNYLQWSKSEVDEYGFPDKGDGLLFACLRYAAGADDVYWRSAEVEPGRYERHPDLNFPEESSSKFSKDMNVGLMFCFWKAQDLETVKKRINYLENNDFDMCGGRDGATEYKIWLSRCKLTDPSLTYRIGVALGGEGSWKQYIPQVWNPWETGFRTHLTVLGILIRGIVDGAVNDNQLSFLAAKARDNPDNALYEAVHARFTDGDMSRATKLLLDETHWPKYNLPTNGNHCTRYLYQRDQYSDDGTTNPDWEPCETKRTHPGTDFIFAAAVALGEI